jgi:eukaryotic-like serine/threonine-protein kinase
VDDFLLPGYDVEELVGFGGSGQVWRAREGASGELVALKRLRASSSADQAAQEVAEHRLSREAALLATISHEHIVALRSVVPTDDGLVLVLDYAEGGSLAALLAARGRLSAGEVVTIGAPLAQALGDVHARGVVHGDVTPANVLFDGSGKPLLADLGVASLAGDRAGPPGGTLGYADPGLDASVSAAGPASDVHGLAAVCFSALTGVPPYLEGSTVAQPLRPLAPGTPATLVAAIEAGLDPDPASRPDANAFARALFAACAPVAVRLVHATAPVVNPLTRDLGGRPPAAPSESAPSESAPGRHRWSPRRAVLVRRVVTVMCAVVLLGAAVAAGIGWAWAGDSHRASASPDPATPAAAAAASATPPRGSALASAATVLGAGPSAAVTPAAAVPTDWTAVLSALDCARDAAFTEGRADELDAVYVPGSAALITDRDTLSRLVKAGQHARGLRFQLASVQTVAQSPGSVTAQSPGSVTLAVADTLAGYDIVGPTGSAEAVAGRGLRTWTVVLRAQPPSGPWRIASINAT